MRENIFARLTQSIAYVAVGAFLMIAADETFSGLALAGGLFFLVIGFLVAISAALQYIPRWIIVVETIASVLLYLGIVGALIKVGVIDGVEENKALIIILFVFVIVLPVIQAIRILRNPR